MPPLINPYLLIALTVLSPAVLTAREIRTDKDLEFYEIVSFDRPPNYLGFSSSKLENIVDVPMGSSWFVRPDGPMNEERFEILIKELKEKSYPGFDLSNRWDVTNKTLEHLAGARHLRILRLSNTKITDEGLKILDQLPQLENLSLNNQTSDKGLERVASLTHLKALDFHGARISEAGLQVLKKLPKLESLDVSGTRLTDNAAKTIATLSTLRQLDISGTDITDKGLAYLADLEKLEVFYTNALMTNRGLAAIAKLKRLRSLDLSRARISDTGAEALRGLTRMEALALSDTPVTDETLYTVSALRKLETLELSGTRVTSEGLAHLAHLSKLDTLSLGWTNVSTVEWQALGSLPQVSRVILNGRSIGQDVLTRIRVMAKQQHAGQKSLPFASKRAETKSAPSAHPGAARSETSRTLVSKPAPRPTKSIRPSAVKDLPASMQDSGRILERTEQREPGFVIEVAAAREARDVRRAPALTGLKRLHQMDLSEKPKDLDLAAGASPVIPSSDPDPKNSLGEIIINAR